MNRFLYVVRWTMLLFAFSLALRSPAFAISLEELSQKIEAIDLAAQPEGFVTNDLAARETALGQGLISDPETRQGLIDLAHDYLKGHQVQETIWILDSLKAVEASANLKKKLIGFFRSHTPERSRASRNGEFLGFPGGIRGIFKVAGVYDNPDAEVWVYALNEALGLGLVPFTVKHNDNNREGSLQLVVTGYSPGGIDFRQEKYPKELAAVLLLDFLVQNKDRNFTNWLKRNNRIVAIDHGLTVSDPPHPDWVNYNEPTNVESSLDILLETSILKKLIETSPDELREALRKDIPEPVIKRYIERRAELLSKVGVKEPVSCRRLLKKAG